MNDEYLLFTRDMMNDMTSCTSDGDIGQIELYSKKVNFWGIMLVIFMMLVSWSVILILMRWVW